MSEASDLEKTEEASPQRLKKAREEGQVARSRELSTASVLLGGVGIIWLCAPFIYERMSDMAKKGLDFKIDPRRLSDTGIQDMMAVIGDAALNGLIMLAPLFLGLIILVIGSACAIGGFLFSTAAISVNFGRMSFLTGIGRMFSSHTVVELLKTIAKAVLIGWVGYVALRDQVPRMMALSRYTVQQSLTIGLDMVTHICLVVLAAMLAIVLLDVPWQLMAYAKKMKMSRDELKQEHKESEGDPHIKGRIRQQQREMARRRMMSEIPKADVIVTNPTHYAVALRYDPTGMNAPVVIAKGKNAIALKIREIGESHRIASIEAPPLARALYAHVDLTHPIPEQLYTAVAQVLAWVFQLKKWNDGSSNVMPQEPVELPVPADMDPLNKSPSSTEGESQDAFNGK